ncbi:PucR family transcriptional regulator [Bacillus sp. B-jedd]|uniref:PucR family transcriptional regulator n=1 Tax=Bacillus sp. B-jedd TaxID=1476857 RepID=UPI0005155C01|nr:helix-turn-helix domain-containing protein [Bacillus sp. B-jedd]CEG26540.1 transcriptional regulator, CdaR [Bacillus sp. B-jedd]
MEIPEIAMELLESAEDGLEPLISKFSSLIGCSVLVADPYFQLLAGTLEKEQLNEVIIMPEKEIDSGNPGIFSCRISTRAAECSGQAIPIFHKKNTVGYLAAIGYSYSKEDNQNLLRFAASLCGQHLTRKLEIRKEKQKFKEAFLFDLLYGNIKQKSDITDYARIWDWDLTIPHRIAVFSFLNADVHFIRKTVMDRYLQIVEKAVLQLGWKPIALVRQSQVAVLLPDNREESPRNGVVEAFAKKIFTQIAADFPGYEGACGFGTIRDNPADLFRSYQEAKVAMELGILLGVEVPFFSHLGLARLLYNHDTQDAKEFYLHVLGGVIHYDLKENGSLMDTLEGLAANQFDVTKTAQSLFLHRNTLRYRIKKIEELLNAKLDDMNTRLDISAALKIKQLRKL